MATTIYTETYGKPITGQGTIIVRAGQRRDGTPGFNVSMWLPAGMQDIAGLPHAEKTVSTKQEAWSVVKSYQPAMQKWVGPLFRVRSAQAA